VAGTVDGQVPAVDGQMSSVVDGQVPLTMDGPAVLLPPVGKILIMRTARHTLDIIINSDDR